MKQEDAVVLAKGGCYVVIGALTPVGSSIAQWAADGAWPNGISWVSIAIGALVGAATQTLSFLSQSYGNWKEERKTNGNGQTIKP